MFIALCIAVAGYMAFDLLLERNMNRRVEVLESVVAALLIDLSEDLDEEYGFDEE
jgi:hypothetical protein